MPTSQEDFFDKIQEIIHKEYLEYKTTQDKVFFSLREDNPTATCREAKFEAQSNILVYKFDQTIKFKNDKGSKIEVRTRFPFFIEGTTQSMCDFIAFYAFENDLDKIFCFVINMKSGNEENNKDQMDAGLIFTKFLSANAVRIYHLGKGEGDNTRVSNPNFPIIKILISSNKPPVRKSFNTKTFHKLPEINWYECGQDTCKLDILCETYFNTLSNK